MNEETILSIATCKIDLEGDYISWNVGWTLHNVDSYLIDYKELCKRKQKNFFFSFTKLLYNEAFYICEALGSHLPVPYCNQTLSRFYSRFKEFLPDDTNCQKDIFTPLTDEQEEDVWRRFYDGTEINSTIWQPGEPNGLEFESCALTDTDGMYDVDCATHEGCALCEFKERAIFSLLGTCELELRNIYFQAHQNKTDEIVFRGYGEYRIQFADKRWIWVDVTKNETIAIMDLHEPNFPMGRRNWTLVRQICKQKSGKRVLLLTHCKDNQFTCDDATCISLEKRCDLKYDCLDHSDEMNCRLISFPEGYKKDLPPRGNGKNNILQMSMKILVESVAVDTTLMLIRVSYFLHLSWYDNRLNLINLKETSNLNTITPDTSENLWIPTIGFMNSVGNYHTEADKESYMYCVRKGNKSFSERKRAEESKQNITTYFFNIKIIFFLSKHKEGGIGNS